MEGEKNNNNNNKINNKNFLCVRLIFCDGLLEWHQPPHCFYYFSFCIPLGNKYIAHELFCISLACPTRISIVLLFGCFFQIYFYFSLHLMEHSGCATGDNGSLHDATGHTTKELHAGDATERKGAGVAQLPHPGQGGSEAVTTDGPTDEPPLEEPSSSNKSRSDRLEVRPRMPPSISSDRGSIEIRTQPSSPPSTHSVHSVAPLSATETQAPARRRRGIFSCCTSSAAATKSSAATQHQAAEAPSSFPVREEEVESKPRNSFPGEAAQAQQGAPSLVPSAQKEEEAESPLLYPVLPREMRQPETCDTENRDVHAVRHTSPTSPASGEPPAPITATVAKPKPKRSFFRRFCPFCFGSEAVAVADKSGQPAALLDPAPVLPQHEAVQEQEEERDEPVPAAADRGEAASGSSAVSSNLSFHTSESPTLDFGTVGGRSAPRDGHSPFPPGIRDDRAPRQYSPPAVAGVATAQLSAREWTRRSRPMDTPLPGAKWAERVLPAPSWLQERRRQEESRRQDSTRALSPSPQDPRADDTPPPPPRPLPMGGAAPKPTVREPPAVLPPPPPFVPTAPFPHPPPDPPAVPAPAERERSSPGDGSYLLSQTDASFNSAEYQFWSMSQERLMSHSEQNQDESKDEMVAQQQQQSKREAPEQEQPQELDNSTPAIRSSRVEDLPSEAVQVEVCREGAVSAAPEAQVELVSQPPPSVAETAVEPEPQPCQNQITSTPAPVVLEFPADGTAMMLPPVRHPPHMAEGEQRAQSQDGLDRSPSRDQQREETLPPPPPPLTRLWSVSPEETGDSPAAQAGELEVFSIANGSASSLSAIERPSDADSDLAPGTFTIDTKDVQSKIRQFPVVHHMHDWFKADEDVVLVEGSYRLPPIPPLRAADSPPILLAAYQESAVAPFQEAQGPRSPFTMTAADMAPTREPFGASAPETKAWGTVISRWDSADDLLILSSRRPHRADSTGICVLSFFFFPPSRTAVYSCSLSLELPNAHLPIGVYICLRRAAAVSSLRGGNASASPTTKEDVLEFRRFCWLVLPARRCVELYIYILLILSGVSVWVLWFTTNISDVLWNFFFPFFTATAGAYWSNRDKSGKRFKNYGDSTSSPGSMWTRGMLAAQLLFVPPPPPRKGHQPFFDKWYVECHPDQLLNDLRVFSPLTEKRMFGRSARSLPSTSALLASTTDLSHPSEEDDDEDNEEQLRAPQHAKGQDLIFWLGHASQLLCLVRHDVNILIDPMFSDGATSMPYRRPKRPFPSPIEMEDLPRIDIILLSHHHYGHLDKLTLEKLYKCFPNVRFVAPKNMHTLLEPWGIPADAITELDWWEEAELLLWRVGEATGLQLRFAATPAQNYSLPGVANRNDVLWSGWCLGWKTLAERPNEKANLLDGIGALRPRGPLPHSPPASPSGGWDWSTAKTYYFAGDTTFSREVFEQIHCRFPRIDMAGLPIGAYAPRQNIYPLSMDPESAVQVFQILNINQAYGLHWGTFELTQEALDEPPMVLREAAAEEGVRFRSEGSYEMSDGCEERTFRLIPVGGYIAF
eukprot:gene1576-959_t